MEVSKYIVHISINGKKENRILEAVSLTDAFLAMRKIEPEAAILGGREQEAD